MSAEDWVLIITAISGGIASVIAAVVAGVIAIRQARANSLHRETADAVSDIHLLAMRQEARHNPIVVPPPLVTRVEDEPPPG